MSVTAWILLTNQFPSNRIVIDLGQRLSVSVVCVLGNAISNALLNNLILRLNSNIQWYVHENFHGNLGASLTSPRTWTVQYGPGGQLYHVTFSPSETATLPLAPNPLTFDIMLSAMNGFWNALVDEGLNRLVGSFSIYDDFNDNLLGTGEFTEGMRSSALPFHGP